MESTAEQLVGAVFNGKWKLVRLLGEGGMGAVYEATSTQGEGSRAIKVLHPEFIHEQQVLERFLAEANASQQLQHPNITRVYDSAKAEDGTPYLVMELLNGLALADSLDRGQPFTEAQAAHVGHGVLAALKLAHARGIVHRDLKPDNLLLVSDGRNSYTVKVLDFGIAKVMDEAGGMGNKTRTGVLLGTPGYMSPEQIKNSKGVDPRSDLWSLGIIMYEMLTLKEPFPADNEFARLTAVLSEDATPIATAAPHLAHWQSFFDRALSKDLSTRFQNADEMAQSLSATTGRGPASVAAPSVAAYGAQPHSAVAPSAAVHSAAQPVASQAYAPSQAYPPTHQGAGYGSAPVPSSAQPTPAAAPAQPPSDGRGGTQMSGLRPQGTPTLQGGDVAVAVVPAPPRQAPIWVVAAVGVICLGVGIVIGASL